MNYYPLARDKMRIDAADRCEEEIPLVVKILDHEADFIAMSSQHQARSALGTLDVGYDITHDISAQVIYIVSQGFTNDSLSRLFKAGRARSFNQFFEKPEILFIHGRSSFIRVQAIHPAGNCEKLV
jgi:hypothetical protein